MASALGRAIIGGLDRALTGAALGGRALRRRRAWRVGLVLETGVRQVHERLLRLGRSLGWTALPASLVRAARDAAPGEPPRYPSFVPTPAGVSPVAEALVRGRFVLESGVEGPISALSWIRDPFGNRSSLERLRFHALEWVGELARAYRLTGEVAYLERAKELADRWIAECLDAEHSDNAWSDHGTALRALVLIDLWHACRDHEPGASARLGRLLGAIVRHGEKLAPRGLYRAEHNHGVTQAYALLAIGLAFPALPRAAAWAALGRARLEAQMADNVSVEGLHREHSPYYHFYVFRQFHYAHRLARAHGVHFSAEFTLRLQAMLAAGAHLLKPTGDLPALGDTGAASPVLVEPADLADWPGGAQAFRWSRSGGADGTPAETASALFAGAGYAVLRSGWGQREPFADERWLILRLSTFATSHVHRDLLAFELCAYGADLVVDSGGPFGYRHPLRTAYFLATRAHSTVVVDDQSQEIGESVVRHWQRSPGHDGIVAEHRSYPGVLHRRAVILIRPDLFLVVDRLESDRRHRYAQLFHLAPALIPTLSGLAVATTRAIAGEGPTLTMLPLVVDGLGATLHRGAMDPRQGWVTTGEEQMVPASVVAYHRDDSVATFATLLVPERRGAAEPVAAALEGLPFDGDARVVIERGSRRHVAILGSTGEARLEGDR
ncbi:MAG: heparinase II/III family protein [Candidatus Rokubacteria bacterium]|nr:heparinase II/III family protein [Candidatus Rokubacteria bacterium]